MPRRTSTNSVSLFPFLAVLLCAMGALIVLLVILTHQIRADAERIVLERDPSRAMAAAVAPTIPSPIEKPTAVIALPSVPVVAPIDPNLKLQAKLGELRQRREGLQSQLAVQKDKLAKQALRKESVVGQTRAVRLALDADTQRLKARTAALEQRGTAIGKKKTQLAELVAELKTVKQKAAGAPAKLQIVPFDGRSGTARKPILIECTAEAIRFMPEDVALRPSDIEGFDPRFNPLLAGASALRNYWSIHSGPRGARPYVLLVVRTDGIIAYYAARSLLKPLGTETGYILIEDGQEIAYPELDPLAQAACRRAVAEALELRSAAQFLTANRDDQFQNNRFTVNPLEHDPTRSDHDDLFPVRPRPRSTAPLGRRGLAPVRPMFTRGEAEGMSRNGVSGDFRSRKKSSKESRGNGVGGDVDGNEGTDNGRSHSGDPAFDSGSRFGTRLGEPGQEVETDGVPRRRMSSANKIGGHGSRGHGDGSTGRGYGSPGLESEALASESGSRRSSQQLSQRNQASESGGDHPGQTSQSDKLGGQDSGQVRGGNVMSGDGIPGRESEALTFDSGSQSSGPAPSRLSSPFKNRLRNKLPSSAARSGSQSGRSSGLGLGGEEGGSSIIPFGNSSQPPQKKRWGRSSSTSLISLEHNLPISVSNDVIQVADQPALLIGPDGLDEIVLEDVLGAIDRQAHTWGRPPQNFFWTPHIQAAVIPGGEYTFTRLRGALERAGLRVTDHLDFEARITPRVERTDASPSR